MMKFKLEEEYSHLKLWSMQHIMGVRFILHFLLILLVLLFSVSNCFLLIQIVEVYNGENRLNTVYTSDHIQ